MSTGRSAGRSGLGDGDGDGEVGGDSDDLVVTFEADSWKDKLGVSGEGNSDMSRDVFSLVVKGDDDAGNTA